MKNGILVVPCTKVVLILGGLDGVVILVLFSGMFPSITNRCPATPLIGQSLAVLKQFAFIIVVVGLKNTMPVF